MKHSTDYIIMKVSELLSSRSSSTPFRVCSVGCGTGSLDCLWLSTLVKQFPNLKVQYVGVDLDRSACSVAERNLSNLDFAEIKIFCQDIHEGLEHKNFDLL